MEHVLGNLSINANSGSNWTSDSVCWKRSSKKTASATKDRLAPTVNLKAPADSPVCIGTVRCVTARMVSSNTGDAQLDINASKSRRAYSIPSTNGTTPSYVHSYLNNIRQADTTLGNNITNLTATNIKTTDSWMTVQYHINNEEGKANATYHEINGIYLKKARK